MAFHHGRRRPDTSSGAPGNRDPVSGSVELSPIERITVCAVPFAVRGEDCVESGYDEKSECGSDHHSSNQDDTDAVASLGTWAFDQHQREMPQNGRCGGHQDRTESGLGGIDNRSHFRNPAFLQMICELDDQDPVFRHQSNQGNQSDLGIDVDGGQTEVGPNERPGDCERDGA